MATKAGRWQEWIETTLLADIASTDSPDPVPMLNTTREPIERPDVFDQYRYGRGDGDYLYLLYLLEDDVDPSAEDVVPVYIGETNTITQRLLDHFQKIEDALPIADWEDDGSWGSWSKYDHIAAVADTAESSLYTWILDVDTLNSGPYGYPTYRQELEAKLVGLAHSQPRFAWVFANREFVPNRVVHEMGKVGPQWVHGKTDYEPPHYSHEGASIDATSKTDLWHHWVEQTIIADVRIDGPTPLFDTDPDATVHLTDNGVLKRSDAIDERIRREGRKSVHADGVRDDAPDGILYVLYQLADVDDSQNVAATDIIPRYIGKGEAYGKKNELSANFEEIAHERNATRSFARWGDGNYWHVGELSNTVFDGDSKKQAWANALFEQGTHRLTDEVYLWVRAWNANEHPGPYGYSAYLAEVEPLLIGLAYAAYPDQILNHDGVPDDAPVNSKSDVFQTVPDKPANKRHR